MTTIRNIVLATDFSPGAQAALDRAVLLAQTHGVLLRLLHAFDVSAWHSLKAVFDPQRLNAEPPPDVRMRGRLKELAASLAGQNGLRVEARFAVGEATSAINAFVSAHEASLLVIGSRAEPVVPGLGSTASKLLRSPGCPVLVVRLNDPRPYAHVLSAVDMREASMRAASQAVTLFAQAHHVLLCAVDDELQGGSLMRSTTPEQARLQQGSMHDFAARQLEELAQELSSKAEHPVTTKVIDDVPARAIIAQAAELPADCVVVGHHGQSENARRPLGSMAQQILQHTARDVLVVP